MQRDMGGRAAERLHGALKPAYIEITSPKMERVVKNRKANKLHDALSKQAPEALDVAEQTSQSLLMSNLSTNA